MRLGSEFDFLNPFRHITDEKQKDENNLSEI